MNEDPCLTQIRAKIKQLSTVELQEIAYKMDRKAGELWILEQFENITNLEYVKALIEDEIIIRQIKESVPGMTEESYYPKPIKDPKKALEQFIEHPLLYNSIWDITGVSDSYVERRLIWRRMYPPNR